jgi:histidyl-tRNA synthetase
MSAHLSPEPYKGTRDFYPKEQQTLSYIFDVWERSAQSFGYEKYNASIIESTKLYLSKTSQEIVSDQTFSFTDRGGRDITLRPEMTPTLARLVANRDLPLPARLFSIPNVFRYEKPQRGRLREHYQFNVDMVGEDSPESDAEMIRIIVDIFKRFGADASLYTIKISNRGILQELYASLDIDKEKYNEVTRILDKLEKITPEKCLEILGNIIGESTAKKILEALQSSNNCIEALGENSPSVREITVLIDILYQCGIENIVFTPSLARGFDYYTGFVFEVFDTADDNNRSMFGGGRYNGLLELFGKQNVPFVGFGCGDVTMLDFLESHRLLPDLLSTTEVSLCIIDSKNVLFAEKVADTMRSSGVTVDVNRTDKSIDKQIKRADRIGINYIIVIGDDEAVSGRLTLKELETGKTWSTSTDGVADLVISQRA